MQLNERDVLGDKRGTKKIGRRSIQTNPSPRRSSDKKPVVAEIPEEPVLTEISSNLFDTTISVLFALLFFTAPLFFLPGLTDVLELSKQTLLFAFTLAIGFLYFLKIFKTHEIEIRWTPAYLGIVAWLVAICATSIFSSYPYQSFWGIEKQEYTSLSTILSLSVLVWIAIQTLQLSHILRCINAFVLSLALATCYGLLQLKGIYLLPFSETQQAAFTTIGRIDLWGGLIASSLVLSLAYLALNALRKKISRIVSLLLSAYVGIGMITLFILADRRLWISLFIGLGMLITYYFLALSKERRTAWMTLPCFLIVCAGLFSVWQPRVISLPMVIDPSLKTSVHIALKTITGEPFTGLGPGTFFTSYTGFRPESMNYEAVPSAWELRFDQSGSAFLSTLAGTGMIGLTATLLLIFFFLRSLSPAIRQRNTNTSSLLLAGIIASLGTLLVLASLKPSNMALTIITWLLVACALSLIAKSRYQFHGSSNSFLILSSLGLFGTFAGILVGGYFLQQHYRAEWSFVHALSLDKNLVQTQSERQLHTSEINQLVQKLSTAHALNPYHHSYARALSQALASQLSATIEEQGQAPDIARIQKITTDMIDIAKKTLALNPFDIRNAENLARAYQTITPFVIDADQFAIKNYQAAFHLEPSNPALRVRYAAFLLSESTRHMQKGSQEKDTALKNQEIETSGRLLIEAQTALELAVNLKSDFTPALYYLAVIAARQNQNEEAFQKASRAMELALHSPTSGADATLFHNLGTLFASIEKSGEAEKAFNIALSLNPQITTLWEYALLLEARGDTKGAIARLEEILAVTPDNAPVVKKLQELKNPPTPEPLAGEATSSTPPIKE